MILGFCTFFRRILLDTGEPGIPDYIGHLKTVLKEENATINNIILSHWHNDHIGGVRDVLQVIENAHGSLDCCLDHMPLLLLMPLPHLFQIAEYGSIRERMRPTNMMH